MTRTLKLAARSLAFLVLASAFAVQAHAGAAPPAPNCSTVPEIDPGSMSAAVTLLVGGVLTLSDRRRRRAAV